MGARHDGVPFIVFAPESTVDAATPVFDVTPAELMTAVVTDRRIVRLDQYQTPT